jgi:hypothetical protein
MFLISSDTFCITGWVPNGFRALETGKFITEKEFREEEKENELIS